MASKSTERNKRLASGLRQSGGKYVSFKASPEAVSRMEELAAKVPGLKTQQDVIDYCIQYAHVYRLAEVSK